MVGTDVVIRTEALVKHYGDHQALHGLDLEVMPGEIFGFLGPNGAGKTTTIRLLLDLIRPTSGRAEVLGMDARDESVAIRRRVGYLPGELGLDDGLTGRELLTFFANLRGGDRVVAPDYVQGLAERLDLDLGRRIRDLSKGNKQKIGLVQAFMHRPDLLILDEPTDGLDPLVQHEFQEIVREVRAEGRTVFLSSHLLDEVDRVADRVAIIRAGQLVETGRLEEIKAKAPRRLEIRFARPVAEEFTGLPGVREVQIEGSVVQVGLNGPADALVKAAAQYEVESVVGHEPDLEELFLGYYGEDEHEHASEGSRHAA